MSEWTDNIRLRIDQVKLDAVKGLSVALARVAWLILFLCAASLLLIVLAVALILLLGEVLDSYTLSACIVAGGFLLITLVLWLLRKKLFTGMFVEMFAQLFFEKKED